MCGKCCCCMLCTIVIGFPIISLIALLSLDLKYLPVVPPYVKPTDAKLSELSFSDVGNNLKFNLEVSVKVENPHANHTKKWKMEVYDIESSLYIYDQRLLTLKEDKYLVFDNDDGGSGDKNKRVDFKDIFKGQQSLPSLNPQQINEMKTSKTFEFSYKSSAMYTTEKYGIMIKYDRKLKYNWDCKFKVPLTKDGKANGSFELDSKDCKSTTFNP